MRPARNDLRAPLAFAALGALLSAACRARPAAPPEPAPDAARAPAAAEPAPAAQPATQPSVSAPVGKDSVENALAAGDIAAARAALDALVTPQLLSDCAQALRNGRIVEALAVCQAALEQSPSLSAGLYLSGVCQAALADSGSEAADHAAAVETLLRARDCGPAQLAASRIARVALDQPVRALELARAGRRLGPGAFAEVQAVAVLAGPSESGEQALALAALAAWRAETPGAQRDALFEEALDALARVLAQPPGPPWAWRTLGRAYLDAGRPAEALSVLENGLDAQPDDGVLIELLAQAARESGGTQQVMRVFRRLQVERPGLGLAWLYPGLEWFDVALSGQGDRLRDYRAAESDFRNTRQRDAVRSAECQRFETLCRSGQGWAWIERGDLEQAWGAFSRTREFRSDGLELAHPPELSSAAAGLEQLIDLHLGRGELEQASRAADLLMRGFPDDVALVRQAGNLQRDLGDRWWLLARDLNTASKGHRIDEVRMGELRASIGITRAGDDLIGTPRERDLFFRAGVGRQRASEEAYRRGFAALRRAAELAPDELALGRDAAGLAVYRVPSEIQWARTELARLVDLGASQLEDPDLDAERRFALEEAWGDAHEMLGVIQLEVDLDPLAARRWFERSLAIGPVRRAEIIDHYLPRCAELEARQR